MFIMLKKSLMITRLNLRNCKAAWITAAILFFIIFGQTVVHLILAKNGFDMSDQSELGSGNFLYLLPLLCAILIPARNFRRLINLGCKRGDFFWGSLCTYGVLAAGVSLANLALYYAFDLPVLRMGVVRDFYNLLDVWGWSARGAFVAFLRQSAFLFLGMVFFHTLASLHEWWIGWAVDALIIAVISVFTPIEPLRNAEYAFFRAILFQPSAFLQILTCLALAAALYALNRPILSRRKI
ncbi:MAG: hypothetical protein LBH70_06975, partial [Spirochaetaceae bacterium]|jgi:hypothetical protein|nr:hypothetical protein [Spirochaetaceae bacterium]